LPKTAERNFGKLITAVDTEKEKPKNQITMDYREMAMEFTPDDCKPKSGMVINLKEIYNEELEKYAKARNKKVEELTESEREEAREIAFDWMSPLDMDIP
jgi:hypothetical protein